MSIEKIKTQELIISKIDELTIDNVLNEFMIGLESVNNIAIAFSLKVEEVEAIIRYCLSD
jgi:hypothetical protein